MNKRLRRQQLIRQTAWVGPFVRAVTMGLMGLIVGGCVVMRSRRFLPDEDVRYGGVSGTHWFELGVPLAGLIIGVVAAEPLLRWWRSLDPK